MIDRAARPAEGGGSSRLDRVLAVLPFAAGALVLQVALARALVSVPAGTRAQAIGCCVATLALVLAGVGIGLFARSSDPHAAPHTPMMSLAVTAALIAAVSGAGLLAPGGASAVLGDVGAGSLARTLLFTDVGFIAPFLLMVIGAALGVRAQGRWLPATLGALVALVAGAAVTQAIAVRASYDPDVIAAVLVGGVIVALLGTGFGLAVALRRLAFVELALVALGFGYTVYLGLAVPADSILSSFNIPQEQLLVALAFAPTAVAVCLLAVGASIGFLLTGAGTFDPRFSYEAKVALRYLRGTAAKPSALIRLPVVAVVSVVSRLLGKPVTMRSANPVGSILVISVTGVSLGVMALVVVLSVMSGFENDLKTKILGAHAHVVVNKKGDDFTEYAAVEAKVRQAPGVRTAVAFVLGEGMISSEAGLSGTLVKGVDPAAGAALEDLAKNVSSGGLQYLAQPDQIPGARFRLPGTSSTATISAPADFAKAALRAPSELRPKKVLPGIIVGKELARTLRVYLGDSVNLVSPVSEEIGPTGPQPKLRRFRVAGIFFSGMYEYDSKFAYVHLREAQKFFGMRKKATGIEIRVHDIDDTDQVLAEIKRRVGGYPYAAKDWRDMNKELFSALLLEKLAMFIILTFIVLVASFNIVSTLVMIVLEKGREIAIMKSMGASDASVMKIFVVQGLIVGVGGAILGLSAGVGICLLLQAYGFQLDPDVFYIDRLPVVMDWTEIAVIAVAAVMITYLATIYPAMAAAQLSPVEGLSDE